ncbi:hypothetical protein Hanom_Chr15g01402571 [Helianthus anomalus]
MTFSYNTLKIIRRYIRTQKLIGVRIRLYHAVLIEITQSDCLSIWTALAGPFEEYIVVDYSVFPLQTAPLGLVFQEMGSQM